MKTKEKALLVALRLLNEQGVKTITLRHIAKEMGISHGNLGYHYPSLNDLIFALYERLVGDLTAEIGAAGGKPGLEAMYLLTRQVYERLYAYRFLLLDFVEICRAIPEIKAHYIALQEQREREFGGLLAQLRAEGLLRQDLHETQYLAFIRGMSILGDFWLSSSEIRYAGQPEALVDHYLWLGLDQVVPYLTEAGREAFVALEAKFRA